MVGDDDERIDTQKTQKSRANKERSRTEKGLKPSGFSRTDKYRVSHITRNQPEFISLLLHLPSKMTP